MKHVYDVYLDMLLIVSTYVATYLFVLVNQQNDRLSPHLKWKYVSVLTSHEMQAV